MHRRVLFIIAAVFSCALLLPALSISKGDDLAQNLSEKPASSGLWRELYEGFNFSFRFLTYGTYQDVPDSSQNPDNDFLKIPRYLADLNLRPDAALHFRRFDFSVKPRMNLQWRDWVDGTQKGNDELEDEWFINEWLTRFKIIDTLFVSYGRENLQWGPSYLISPSNPFFVDNGRSNPKMEVAGMDFARIIWLPGMEWTISLIVNTDEGRQEFKTQEFEKSYAVKLDYSGREGYAGLVISHRESDRNRLGAFGGWTATDALIIYGDIGFSQGSNILYPVEDKSSPFGASMQAVDEEISSWKGNVIVGGSYTFLAGPTLTLEYLYNSSGYNDKQAGLYYLLRKDASDTYRGPLSGLSRMTLGRTIDSGLRFLRRNYAVLQYRQNDIKDMLSLSFSWIHNMDEDSERFIANIDFAVGDHTRLFADGSVNAGGGDSEFNAILNYYITLGLEYTF